MERSSEVRVQQTADRLTKAGDAPAAGWEGAGQARGAVDIRNRPKERSWEAVIPWLLAAVLAVAVLWLTAELRNARWEIDRLQTENLLLRFTPEHREPDRPDQKDKPAGKGRGRKAKE